MQPRKLRKIPPRELVQTLDRHKAWRNGEPGGLCADLSFTDFGEVNLFRMDLGGANLRGAKLDAAWAQGVNFSDADMRDCNLAGYYKRFENASFYGADMRGAKFPDMNPEWNAPPRELQFLGAAMTDDDATLIAQGRERQAREQARVASLPDDQRVQALREADERFAERAVRMAEMLAVIHGVVPESNDVRTARSFTIADAV